MCLPAVRITLKTLMAAVAAWAWIAFNGRLITEMLGNDFGHAGADEESRILLFTVLAWVISSGVGCAAATIVWLSTHELRRFSMRGALAGGIAGYPSWFIATVLICRRSACKRSDTAGGDCFGLHRRAHERFVRLRSSGRYAAGSGADGKGRLQSSSFWMSRNRERHATSGSKTDRTFGG